MVEDVGTTITLEAWDNRYKGNQDWNHAWGAAPANVLPRKLLGIEPIEPGWTRLQICPRLGNLKWAEGRVPTPHGAVVVRAEAGEEYRLDVTIPAGTTARVLLPLKNANTVGESSGAWGTNRVKFLSVKGDRAELEVLAGTYKFTATKREPTATVPAAQPQFPP